MSLSIIPIGGFGEVGRNCVAVKVDDEIFILDMGLHLENYMQLSDDEHNKRLSKRLLTSNNAVPDLRSLDKAKVKGILISHAHLDHVGAVPFLESTFSCDIHGTPFTMEIARRLAEDKRTELKNKLVAHEYREIFKLTESVSAELIEVTHSTPQTAAIALHTKYGVVLYINDFKLDESPTLGNNTDLKRLKELKPKALIIDTLYADVDNHTESEQHAKELLEDTLLNKDLRGKLVVATTFASHIARLKEFVNLGKKLKRHVMFIGRSMGKYLDAAKDVGISDIVDKHNVVRYSSKAKKALANAYYPEKYLFVVTGGMAEPGAVLSRVVNEKLLPLEADDVIVFSNRAIPVPSILEARVELEKDLKQQGFEVLTDLHVSGHGAGKDHAMLLQALQPEYVFPLHGEAHQRAAFKVIALENGMQEDTIWLLANHQTFEFP